MKTPTAHNEFSGPLFLIGFGRSGTKLLRSLLNAHPQISIPDVETNFLPMWLMRTSMFRDLSDIDEFSSFYARAIKEPFFTYMKEKDNLISADYWYSNCTDYSASGIYESLIKFYCKYEVGLIWGDKSPANTRFMTLLKASFPESRFIHIVRDVRDCCASAKLAWNSNIYRAAQRWSDILTTAKSSAGEIGNDYYEIRFEDLLSRPEKELHDICVWLSIEYSERMLELTEAPEQYGDAAGSKRILSDNKNKYSSKLTPSEILGIEKIATDCMTLYGYHPKYSGPSRRLSKFRMSVFRVKDGMNHLRRNMRDRGILGALTFSWKFFRQNTLTRN